MTDTARAQEDTPAPASVAPVSHPPAAAGDRGLILLAAILASSLGFIDGSVTAISMPAMRASLHASLEAAQWIGNAYLLALSSLVLVGGAMGDRFGVARVFRAGIVLFVLASLLCALAPDAGTLIAARALKGVGAAFMVPGSMAIIARVYPPEERGRALGLWAAASSLTTALGPVLGGALISFGPPGAWRVIFAINLPVGAVAWWLILTRVRHDPGRPDTPVDLAGAGLATAGLGLLAYALTHMGARGSTLAAAAGIAALAAFLAWEARTAHPMLPLRLFADRAFAFLNLSTFFIYFALTSVVFFLPMAAVTAWAVPEVEVTAAFVPVSALIGLLSAPAGRLADRIGPRPLIGTGAALMAAGYGALALFAHEADFWFRVVPAMAVAGLGLAALVAPLTAAVMSGVGPGDTGSASGINNAVARVAGLVAVAAMGSVAGFAYKTAGGQASFGERSGLPAHAAATTQAFAVVAALAAAAAGLGALIALAGLPRRRP